MSDPTHNEEGIFRSGCYALDAPSVCSGGANQRATKPEQRL